jgi:hypothetical protein
MDITENPEILQAAKWYINNGFSVIPVGRDKKPKINWREYQTRHATDQELTAWFSNGDSSLAIVTGSISNLAVVDLDTPDACTWGMGNLPQTATIKTGKGYHMYYRFAEGVRNIQARKDLPGVDLRGEGGFVVAPPSIHESGNIYSLESGSFLNLARFPSEVFKSQNELSVKQSVTEGSRNTTLAREIGGKIKDGKAYEQVRREAHERNRSFVPPLSTADVDTVVNSVFQTAENKGQIVVSEPPQEWPTLSPAALPGLLGEFVNAACQNSEADPAAVLSTFLVRFGIECGPSPHYKTGDTRHAARLNAVVIGDSSKARKGTSAGPVKAIFSGLLPGCVTSPGPLSSGEGIIYAVRNEQRTWIVDKKTGAGEWQITDPGIDDKRLFILDEEFSNALNATKREGNTLSGIIRGLYDDGNAAPLTKSNRIETTGAHVGIVSHTTLAELKIKLSENEQLNGFGNRFLWICARRQGIVPFPESIPEETKFTLRNQLQERLQHAFQGGEYRLSQEARELWKAEYPRLSIAHKGLAGCMINRAEAHVVRLALIYAILSLNSQIERQDLEAAIAFWSYCQDSALYLFGGEQVDRRKSKILTALTAQPRLTRNEIREQVFQKHLSSDSLTALLNEMQQEQLIEIITEQTGGAPRQVVILKSS